MKQGPHLERIQANMKPGILTEDGFMGDGTGSLADIIAEDNAIVQKLMTNHQKIADRLRCFTQKGMEGLGCPVKVDDIYVVTVEEHKGTIACPFGDNESFGKRNTEVVNTVLKATVRWSDLNIHMIEKHGFYEGKGALFRVDPMVIADVLGGVMDTDAESADFSDG